MAATFSRLSKRLRKSLDEPTLSSEAARLVVDTVRSRVTVEQYAEQKPDELWPGVGFGLDQQFFELAKLMERSSLLFQQVSAEMSHQRNEVKKLQQGKEDAKAVAAFNEAQLAVIDRRLAKSFSPEANKAIKWAAIIGELSFIVGAAATVAVALFFHL